MSDAEKDAPLGYGHPPTWGRFQKGKSGNPKGRPKKKETEEPESLAHSEMDRIRREALNQEITIREGGVPIKLKAVEILMKSQINNGIKGKDLAQRDAIRGAEDLEKRDARRAREQKELAEEQTREKMKSERQFFDRLVKLKQSQAKAWAEAQTKGKDEPDFPWPHPDDIMLDEGRELYRLRGPMDGKGVSIYRFMQAQRDLALARMVRELDSKKASRLVGAKLWGTFVQFYDKQLPLRWQLETDWTLAAADYYEMNLQELEAAIEQLEQDAAIWERVAKVEPTAESYRVANDALKPSLEKFGYKSLAQFERACDETDGNPPWPRRALDGG